MVASGWYMLEIELVTDSATARLNSYSYQTNHNSIEFTQLHFFPLYKNRLCKRLVFLKKKEIFNLIFPVSSENLKFKHFRLIRVTEKFAKSRMRIKLEAIHPSYKLHYKKKLNNSNLKNFPTSSLWKDYCDIFEENEAIHSYLYWVSKFDTITEKNRISMRRKVEKLSQKPLISVLMPVYNPNPLWLESAINSVQSQIYPHWELCIADDASSDRLVIEMLERYAQSDPRIKLILREENGHISAASNSALTLARGDWIALLDHDDLLPENALFWVADAIINNPECLMIYSDEDKIDNLGVRSDPYFKCDWNPDLFYSQNMFSHLGVYQTNLVRAVGGFRVGMEGSQDYDLALRCIDKISDSQVHHIPRVLYHWRIHADSTAMSSEAKPYAMKAGEKAINEHFQRRNLNAFAEAVGYGYRTRYALPAALPLVSLIIPTRNRFNLLKKCIESIQEKTSYKNYEIIIVDNGSNEVTSLRYLENLSKHSKIQIIRDNRPFNYSALNNAAVREARGLLVGLLNNDVEVINPDWLSEMVSHAIRPEVGAVGARLWYADNTIQHAGVVLGIHGIAEHVHRFLPRGNVGYCGRANLIQSFSAVTAACLLVRKSVYEEVGGLNEVELQVACNDIDFCLRVREAGYRNIWTPYAELYHHESASRGFDDTPEKQERSAKEIGYMHRRWGNLLFNDPAYSPNLSLDANDFSLAWPPRVESLDPHENLAA